MRFFQVCSFGGYVSFYVWGRERTGGRERGENEKEGGRGERKKDSRCENEMVKQIDGHIDSCIAFDILIWSMSMSLSLLLFEFPRDRDKHNNITLKAV